MLRIERDELAGERQHFAAIIEVAGELEPAHRSFRGGGGGRAAAQGGARILGELMHVDDMRDRSEGMQISERALPCERSFERYEEEQYRAREEDEVHRRLDPL